MMIDGVCQIWTVRKVVWSGVGGCLWFDGRLAMPSHVSKM